nr:uncharacterized protein LOC121114069 isoform X1 [Lepeophtheirus salmonis]
MKTTLDLLVKKKSFIKTMNKSPKNKVFQKSNGFGSGKRSPQKSFDNINDKNRIRCNSESSLDKRIDSKKHDYTQAADKNIHNKSNPVSDHEKSQSTGSSKFQSKFLLKKYSDMSLPRSRTERKSVEKDEKKFRMRSSSLPRTKFGLPNRRASLIRQPSTDHVVPKSEDSHDEPHSHEDVNSKMRTKSEPNIFENGISNRPENPRRQYGRRSGRFRRAPPSRQIITIQNRPHSSERSGVLTEEEKRLNGNEIRPRHRASSLPRLNSGSRQRRRSQGRNSAHSNDLCNIQ